MAGSVARSEPKEKSDENTENKTGFAGVEDRSAGPNPVDQPASRRRHRRGTQDADRNDSAATPEEDSPAYTDNNGPAPIDPDAVRPVEARLPPVKTIPIRDLELYGLLNTSADRSLGIDMWIGSTRAEIAALIPLIPPQSRYRTLQDITNRMLLTHTDSEMMGGPALPAGEDLMTLRLEKLNEIGAYDQAARLYAVNPGRPYHERLARAGVTAMIYSGRHALGCLEVKALQDSYKDVPFWQQVAAICDIYFSRDLEKSQQIAVPTDVFINSPLLQKLVDNPSFRTRPANIADLTALTPVERLGFFTLQRVDYSKLVKLSLGELMTAEPALLSSLLADSTLPSRLRMFATLGAVAQGVADIEMLTAFYDSGHIPGLDKEPRGWKQLPALYRHARQVGAGAARDAVLGTVMGLRRTFGTTALLPFAPMLAESDPGNFTPESISSALAVMVKAGQDIPEKWRGVALAVLSPGQRPDDTILAYLALDVSQGFKPLKSLEKEEFQGLLKNMGPETVEIVKIIYEKLDNGSKLHNIGADGTYEKDSVLTESDDYVMPLSSLLNALELAQKDKRLGEVILISSILLRSPSPGKIPPEVLGDVLDGYKTVGLTKEARDLAAEVILGLRK